MLSVYIKLVVFRKSVLLFPNRYTCPARDKARAFSARSSTTPNTENRSTPLNNRAAHAASAICEALLVVLFVPMVLSHFGDPDAVAFA